LKNFETFSNEKKAKIMKTKRGKRDILPV
jgi:hypothetical protein